MRRTWPEQRRHVVVCLMKDQLANYSSGSFTWSRYSWISWEFWKDVKRKMAQRRDSQRDKSLPAILMKTNMKRPAILMKTIMKRSESSEEEFVGDLQGSSRCAGCRWPHVVQLSLPLQASCPLHEPWWGEIRTFSTAEALEGFNCRSTAAGADMYRPHTNWKINDKNEWCQNLSVIASI